MSRLLCNNPWSWPWASGSESVDKQTPKLWIITLMCSWQKMGPELLEKPPSWVRKCSPGLGKASTRFSTRCESDNILLQGMRTLAILDWTSMPWVEFRHRMGLQKNGRQGKKKTQRAAESKTRISKYKQTKQQLRLLEMSYGRFFCGSALYWRIFPRHVQTFR